MDKIIIIGGGGLAKVVISILRKVNKYEICGYTDTVDRGSVLQVPYLGDDVFLEKLLKTDKIKNAVIGVGGIGDTSLRRNLETKLREMGFVFPSVVSPYAILNDEVSIAEGTIVMDGVVINSGTKIGIFNILNTCSSIDHDCKIGNFVQIAPGAVLCGGVEVGNDSFIGAGSTIIQSRIITDNCVVGAGAVVVKDCLKAGKYFGVLGNK